MTTSTRTRRVSSPAYYLARPAALWLAAFSPQSASASASEPEPRLEDRGLCIGEVRGPAGGIWPQVTNDLARGRVRRLRVPSPTAPARSANLRMSRARRAAMLGSMMTYYRAWENRRFVRTLLREEQPEFADVLESAVREVPCLRCHGSRCSEATS